MGAERVAALDGARAVAIALVVLVHGLVPVMVTDIGWAVHQPAGTLVIDGTVWAIRAFVLPLFFLLAGTLAARTVASGGLGRLVRRRALRLVLPLAIFVVPVSWSMNALWDWGKSLTAERSAAAAGVPALRASEHAVTLGHLWFLYYLIVVTAAAVLVVAAARRLALPRLRLPTGALPLLCAGPVAATLFWGGKLQLDTPLGFAVDGPIALYHGVFFAWGWRLDAAELESYRARLLPWLALAAALMAALVPPLARGAGPAWAFVASAGLSCALIAAVLGASARWLARPRPSVRLASRASYWIYVVHLPPLVFFQVATFRLGLPAPLEVAVCIGLTLALCLASYRWLVQGRWLGRLFA